MPSFAIHPINRITRSISSPNPIASPPPRSRNSNLPSHSSTPPQSHHHHPHQQPDQVTMHRLNPLHFISAVTSSPSPTHHHSQPNKPPSPLSSSSASSAQDSLAIPSFSRSASYNAPSKHHHHPRNAYTTDQSTRPAADLPPVSPMSSMYDPHSPGISPDSSRASDASSSSASDSPDGNVFLRPRSTHENRLWSKEMRPPVVSSSGPMRAQPHDLGHPVAFRRALFERPSSPSRTPATAPLQSRESLFAGIAARGRVVDAFVASPHVSDVSKPHDTSQPVQGMSRIMSGKSLEIPRGKVEQLPPPRPVTPCHIPRPETPSRLPRPRVFIKPSPSRQSVVDPVAVTHDSEMGSGEAEFVTREIPRPTTPAPCLSRGNTEHQTSSARGSSLKDDFYFSDEETVDDDILDYPIDSCTAGHPSPSDMLSYKVRRAVSALRSISFQSHNPEDVETAWGQANTTDPVRDRNKNASASSSRWRRACGRISSKNGVQEYDIHSEVDGHNINSYNSNFSVQRGRGAAGRDQLRGIIGVPVRGDRGSRQRRSLWTGAKRDRQQSPQTRAAELLLSNNQGLLAASTDAYDGGNVLTAVSPVEHSDMSGTQFDGRRGSGDKYVEFIHASVQRGSRSRSEHQTLRSRIVNRMFRRRWNGGL